MSVAASQNPSRLMVTITIDLTRDQAFELESIADDAVRCAWRERQDYRGGIFAKVRDAVRRARAEHLMGGKR